MAGSLARMFGNMTITNNCRRLVSLGSCRRSVRTAYAGTNIVYQQHTSFHTHPCDNSSFFVQVSADDLWKGVVGVSNAGKKKGRGKRVGRKKITDLNKGQFIGEGKLNMVWPGLNSPVIKGREVMTRKQLPPDPKRSEEMIRLRDQMSRIRYTANPPLLRGWSGSRFPGQSVGPPDPVGDYTFEGFDSRVLEFKLVTNMTGTLGRKMSFSALVVTGNKNGLAGLGLGKAQSGRAAIRVNVCTASLQCTYSRTLRVTLSPEPANAKNRAAQRLRYIPLYNNHTVYHNMFTQYHRSKVFIHKKEEGFGLRCHRAIKTCCELIGIKDLHCKVEASTKNVNAVTQAFFDALVNQETHGELADRMGYHVVEFRKERDNLPVVVASPTSGVVREAELKDEEEDLEVEFDRLYFGGRCELQRPPKKWFYSKFKSYKKKKAEMHAVRNQPDAQILRRAGLW